MQSPLEDAHLEILFDKEKIWTNDQRSHFSINGATAFVDADLKQPYPITSIDDLSASTEAVP